MKTVVSSAIAISFVVLATTASFANIVAPQPTMTVHSGLSEADALRLKLALQADEAKGG